MMNRITYISFILCCILLSERISWAQESCVFLPKIEKGNGRFDRPNNTIWRKHFPPTPQSLPQKQQSDFPNINVTQIFNIDQDEPSIAISPTDPNTIIIGANDYRSFNSLWRYYSSDGGATWDNAPLQPATNLAYATDPAVAFNAKGDAFFSNGRVSAGGLPYPRNDVVCYRSTDGGKNFGQPARVFFDTTAFNEADTLADKYYLAVDKSGSSSFVGNIYVCWAEYVSGKSRVVLSHSRDNGVTWSIPLGITGFDKYQCPIPAVNDAGDVFISYLDLNTSKQEIYVARIIDGGNTLSSTMKIANYKNLGQLYPASSNDPHPVIKGHLRVNSFPSIAAASKTLYITWAAKGDDGRHHIYFSRSTDTGNSWTQPKAIEGDTSSIATDKFFPWIAFDKLTGDVGVVFYDSRLDGVTNQKIDLFMAHSTDDGETFAVRRISDESFDPAVASSTDSLQGNGDTLAFFGDYIGLAASGGVWHAAWTDSRVGYDQDIYTARIKPRAPTAVTKLSGREDSITHHALLSWDYTPQTTFGRSLQSFQFLLVRSDGGVHIPLASDVRTYDDATTQNDKDYEYSLRVISPGDSSIAQIVRYLPLGNRKPRAPEIVDSKAEIDGLHISFIIPDRSESGSELKNLDTLFYFIDGIPFQSLPMGDGQRGEKLERSFSLPTEIYHNIQLAVSTNRDGCITYSERSKPVWLYAGTPLDNYSENFESSKNIFSPYSWNTTSVDLPSTFINDSLPNTPYQSGKNTWFLLPPVKITSLIHTLEFDHIGLIAQGDSAMVEISTNNGLTFDLLKRYDKNSEPTKWSNTLAASTPAHDSVALKYWKEKDAVIRFRLGTHSSNGDGWFVDNIHFTDLLGVLPEKTMGLLEARLTSNPVLSGKAATIELHLQKLSKITVTISDQLGNIKGVVCNGKVLSEGEYLLDHFPNESGMYYFTVDCITAHGKETIRGRFIVIE